MSRMPDYSVHRYGTDPSGRGIWMTVFMHDWIEARVAAVGFRPVVVQGCFMTRDGGGAADSDGAHDKGGSVDFRTWDLTKAQSAAWVKECRQNGGAAYRRGPDPKHGDMEEHCHVTVAADHPISPMAQLVWNSYVSGGDGLAAGPGRPGNAPDYEWRPSPLVLTPPQEEDVPFTDWPKKDQDALAAKVWAHMVNRDKKPTHADAAFANLLAEVRELKALVQTLIAKKG